jgi:signal transduction histidine kinase
VEQVRSYLADAVLALVIAVAAGSAASGAPSGIGPLLVVLAVGAGLSLAVRRLYPLEVFVLTVATTTFFAAVYDGYWPFAALIVFYTLAAHTPRSRALVAGTAGLASLAVPVAAMIDWQPFTWSKLALWAGRLAPLVAAWVIGDNMRTRRAYMRALEERASQLEREQEANTQRAAAEEQARIAREVHDIIAHNLSVIVVQATAADAVLADDPVEARRAVRAVGNTARQALGELRRVLGVVRSDEERSPEFPPQPSLAVLDGLLDQVRAAGLVVDVDVVGRSRELPAAIELSAYRIVQEALTNTLRHGEARHATVRLSYDSEDLGLEVLDDGGSSEPTTNGAGHGLVGMRERVATFGGELEAGPTPGGGFRVAARLPLDVSHT